MNLFQWLALCFLGVMVVWDLAYGLRAPVLRRGRLVRCSVWLAAAVAIARPALVQEVALAIGIGRGADVVLYVFVLAFLATAFYGYSRQVHLQRQVTELVRHLAIQEARRGLDATREPPPTAGTGGSAH
jgi:hypothetical protein